MLPHLLIDAELLFLPNPTKLLTRCCEDQVGVPSTNLVGDCSPSNPASQVACKRFAVIVIVILQRLSLILFCYF